MVKVPDRLGAVIVWLSIVIGLGLVSWTAYGRYQLREHVPAKVIAQATPVASARAPISVARPSAARISAVLPGETKGQAVARLIASESPADAHSAFIILQRCTEARTYEAEIAQVTDPQIRAALDKFPKPDELCEGVMPGQVTQRLQLAIKAADAGVPGAYQELARMEAEYPDDPTLKEAIPRIVNARVKAADPDVLAAQFQIANNCYDAPQCTSRDVAKALTLWTAYREVKPSKMPDQVTPGLVAQLGPERAQQAVNEGKALVLAATEKH